MDSEQEHVQVRELSGSRHVDRVGGRGCGAQQEGGEKWEEDSPNPAEMSIPRNSPEIPPG